MRKQSSTGIYHVMLRGINRQRIFHDKEDYTYFLECLYACKQISRFRLYAYCLMGNHVHLLINAKDEPIDMIMRRLGSKYVYWYNSKYERIGHLFQSRFKSEPVEADSYFLTVLRYIHMNPVKAGIVSEPEGYTWSSYREYFEGGQLIDTKLVVSMLDAEQFVRWHNELNDDICLDIDDDSGRQVVSDADVMAVLTKLTGCHDATDFVRLSEYQQILCVKELQAAGASIRQIGRVTGCGKSRVERWLKR